MTAQIFIDSLNKKTMQTVVEEYANLTALYPAETKALEIVAPFAKGGKILDIGVGGGRTVESLQTISSDYIGIDYVPEMVDACRSKFPGVQFEVADARSMHMFADAVFDLVVFSMNGLCMVDHDGRMAILKEIRRVLKPTGSFIFSSYNLDSPMAKKFFWFPDRPRLTLNPVRFAWRFARFSLDLIFSFGNRFRFKSKEIKNAEYSILNDKCHRYRTMLYYISIKNQFKQLTALNFNGKIRALDSRGNDVFDGSPDDSIIYIVSG